MQVFKHAIDQNGGKPLPLGLYLLPTVEGTRTGVAEVVPALSPTHTRLDRVSFFEAVLDDIYFTTVSAFLLGGLSPNVRRDEDGASVLHIAVSGTTKLTPSSLEEMGIVKNIFDPPCRNQLIISFLIDNGADVDAENNRGETPLMTAVGAQNMRAVKLLLAKGADLERRDHSGHMVLHFAAPHPHVIQSLQVWIGSEELPRMAREEHLLHTVCGRAGTSLSALFLIEQLELDVNAARAPAHHQGAQSPTTNTTTGTTSVAVQGESGGSAADGETPLHCAVRTGDVALVKALLSKGADPLKSDTTVNGGAAGTTPLQLANALGTRRTGSKRSAATRSSLVNHSAVHQLLRAYAATTPNSRAREALLGESSIQLWRVNDVSQWVQAIAIGAGPHIALGLACVLLNSFTLLALALVGLLFVMFQVRVTDENLASDPIVPVERAKWKPPVASMNGVPRRPMRSFAIFVGCMVAILWSLCVEFRHYPSAQLLHGNFSVRATLADEAARVQHDLSIVQAEAYVSVVFRWMFVPTAVLTVVCLLMVVIKSPGTVSSTAGQRKGIYANILRAKGVPSKELLYSTDLATMVKKPLRAQRCPFVERVILRYDHFSLHLASPIGARTYRAFVYGHVALCLWLLSMTFISSGLMDILSKKTTLASEVAFSTPCLRMAYLYTRVLLPLFVFMSGFIVFEHVLDIRRNVSSFDISHACDDSSLYCFELGTSVYSLFDQGPNENLKRFLLCRDALDEVTFRLPQMSPYMAGIVREHERWQLNAENNGGCDGGGDHGHSHGGGGASAPVGVAADGSAVYEAGPDRRLVTAEERVEGQMQFLTGSADLPPEKAAHQPKASDTVAAEEVTSLAYGLFQELIKHGGDPELFRTTQRAARSGFAAATGAALSEDDAKRQAEWDEAVAEAREMYRYFQENMQSSMQRFIHEHVPSDAAGGDHHGHSHGSMQEESAPNVKVPVVEKTFIASSKHD